MKALLKNAKKIFRFLKRKADIYFGTIIDEIFWSLRGKKWVKNCLSPESIKHPHRQFLLKIIGKQCPFKSIMEVGCASGPNLYLLSKKFHHIDILGTDINKAAVIYGNKWFAEKGIINVNLNVAKADNLKRFADKSIDVVFSDALFIYIAPDKINQVLKELFRVSNKALIFNELHYGNGANAIYKDHWIYDWNELLKNFVKQEQITISRIPQGLWLGQWQEFGCVIEARL
jgi:ubiquinone/menaquinone biosynthesis C-methylase UbiE